MRARIDITVADPVLERDAPLPARRARGRARERQMIAAELARHSKRPVAREPFRPIVETGLQRLLNQQAAKSRTVDEEVGFDPCAALQHHPLHEAGLTVLHDVDDAAFGTYDARRFGEAAKIAGVERGIELESVADLRQRRVGLIEAR